MNKPIDSRLPASPVADPMFRADVCANCGMMWIQESGVCKNCGYLNRATAMRHEYLRGLDNRTGACDFINGAGFRCCQQKDNPCHSVASPVAEGESQKMMSALCNCELLPNEHEVCEHPVSNHGQMPLEGGTVPEVISCGDYTHPRYKTPASKLLSGTKGNTK